MDEKRSDNKQSVRPFFIMATKNGPGYSKEVLNGEREATSDYHFISSEHIMRLVSVVKHGKAEVTKVTMNDEAIRYVPLPPEELLSLMNDHGYEVYGPKATRELHQELSKKEKKFTLE
jgi:hypothetical protein